MLLGIMGKRTAVEPKPRRNAKRNEFRKLSFPKLKELCTFFLPSITKIRDALQDGQTDTLEVSELFHLIRIRFCTS
jgi:hypothetical protein